MKNLALGTAMEALRYPLPTVGRRGTPRSKAIAKKRRACKVSLLADQLEKVYREGVDAFNNGIELSANPYGLGQPMDRCAWSGGWVDAQRGMVKETEHVG